MLSASHLAHQSRILEAVYIGNHRFCQSPPQAGSGRTWQKQVLPLGWQKVFVLPRTLLASYSSSRYDAHTTNSLVKTDRRTQDCG